MSILSPRSAAVLVLHNLHSNSIVLTKRTQHLPIHAGEICFPGGGFKADDATLLNTALREVEEELGIESDRITIINPLSPVDTLTGFNVHAWFACISDLNPFTMDVNEVDSVLEIPIDKIIDPSQYIKTRRSIKNISFTVLEFQHEKEVVWGATARIMFQLSKKLDFV
jgi:8-oxo-dGTP pyrophosphatase MutT (NUDIX family)